MRKISSFFNPEAANKRIVYPMALAFHADQDVAVFSLVLNAESEITALADFEHPGIAGHQWLN